MTMSAPSSTSSAPRAAPRRRWPDPSGSRGGRRTPASSRRPRGTGRRRRRRTSRSRRGSACRRSPPRRARARIAPTRPSIMSLGRDDVGARARLGDRGAREQLERRVVVDRPSGVSRPQWPWSVYSHRQTSVMTSSSGCASLIARVASWTMPVVVPGAASPRRPCGRDAEQQDGGDAERGGLAGLARRPRRSSSRSTPGIASIGVAAVEPLRRRTAAGRGRRARASSRARGRAGRGVARRRRRRVAGKATCPGTAVQPGHARQPAGGSGGPRALPVAPLLAVIA